MYREINIPQEFADLEVILPSHESHPVLITGQAQETKELRGLLGQAIELLRGREPAPR